MKLSHKEEAEISPRGSGSLGELSLGTGGLAPGEEGRRQQPRDDGRWLGEVWVARKGCGRGRRVCTTARSKEAWEECC